MKFAILTGGGDSSGMNAFIRSVIRCAINTKESTAVWGIIDGWKGLIDSNFKRLSIRDSAGITAKGGTILGTLRAPELKEDIEIQESAAMNLHDKYIDYLFIIGGNGSLQAANCLDMDIKKLGLRTKILFAPGSIDNDVCNNHGYSIGFYSAIDKSLEMLDWIRDTASSHRRVYLVASMGRDSGYLAYFAGVASGAEYVIRPRETVDFEKIATMIDERDRDTRIIVAEGYEKSLTDIEIILEDIFLRRGIKHEIRHVDMGYFQRGGKAVTKDIMLASWLGFKMVADAFNKCDSTFYTAYNGGSDLTKLTLAEAADEKKSNHMDIPRELIDFSLSLR